MRHLMLSLLLFISVSVEAQVYTASEVDQLPRLLLGKEIRYEGADAITSRNELRQIYGQIKMPALCRQARLYEEYRLTYLIDQVGKVSLDTLVSTHHIKEYPIKRGMTIGPDTILVLAGPVTCGGGGKYTPVLADTIGCRTRTRDNISNIIAGFPDYSPAIKDGNLVRVRKEFVILYGYRY